MAIKEHSPLWEGDKTPYIKRIEDGNAVVFWLDKEEMVGTLLITEAEIPKYEKDIAEHAGLFAELDY